MSVEQVVSALPQGLGVESQPYVAQITARIPQVMRLLGLDGKAPPEVGPEMRLGDYVASLRGKPLHSASFPSFQRRLSPQDGDDLLGVACAETHRLLGEKYAKALARTLEDDFCALTANHHGVDFHPEFAQGMLIFALERWNKPAVPVFSVGGVPMDNVGFPRGICLGSRGESNKPRHISLIPNRKRHTLVCQHSPVTKDMIDRALSSAPLRELKETERHAVSQILELYTAPDVLALHSFSEQATMLNSRVWHACHKPELRAPFLITLDMQSLSGQLAARDAADTSSLFHALVLEPQGTLALCHALNGKRGCWTLGEYQEGILPVERGSFLFWALDSEGRAVSMSLDTVHHVLRASQRPDLDVPLTPQGIAQALAQKKVIPSLFLYFALLALARGLLCCGGVYQIGYLPEMVAGVRHALSMCGEGALAERVAACSPMSTGFLPLRMPVRDSLSSLGDYAAGPVEFLMSGGLDADVLGSLRSLSVHKAFAAGLAYHYEDLVSEPDRLPGWSRALSVDCGIVLQ